MDELQDLIDRMKKAETNLSLNALRARRDGNPDEEKRLTSKAQGVRLCLSYAEEALRLRQS